ncbi:hypothetical protein CGLO_12560 [Colletotrichum gloeosporioides Cg-14]|uniref:Uncharacterized protein n=1 Tax=Colletotrichum gloeosporioides (strain Cg-14) TaxID=1237896 RepID=T0K5J0_COLGC|nr:hypothetical protein CGLO_12560 [Colletotrichum gloeosporioides Cg-14]
MEIKSPTFSS